MERPTSVTVFGILNIVFAAFGIFGTLGSLALFSANADMNNPVIKIIHDNPNYALWMKICISLGLIVTIALLAAGSGLLKLKPWARTLSIAYAIYAIVFGIISIVANYFFLTKPLMEQAQGQHDAAAAAAVGAAIGGAVGGCVGMVYPILLLIFMTRPNVIAAFKQPLPLN